jgi:hypothetical protein
MVEIERGILISEVYSVWPEPDLQLVVTYNNNHPPNFPSGFNTFIGKHCRSPPARAHLGKPLSARRLYCSANQMQSIHADWPRSPVREGRLLHRGLLLLVKGAKLCTLDCFLPPASFFPLPLGRAGKRDKQVAEREREGPPMPGYYTGYDWLVCYQPTGFLATALIARLSLEKR